MSTTAELAKKLGTTPRQFRRFLRDEGLGVGQGQRYELPSKARELNALTKRYKAWGIAHTRGVTSKK